MYMLGGGKGGLGGSDEARGYGGGDYSDEVRTSSGGGIGVRGSRDAQNGQTGGRERGKGRWV